MARRLGLLLSATLLCSCASLHVTPVQPYGKDAFSVSSSSRNPTRARAAAIDAANAHCTQQGKTMAPQSEQMGTGTSKVFTLVFSCTS